MKIDSEQIKKIDENYIKLQSADFMQRYSAVNYFIQIKMEALDQKIRNELVDRFIREAEQLGKYERLSYKPGMTRERLPKEMLYITTGEAFVQYFSRLCRLVAKSNDPRVVPLLVEHCQDPKLLISFGELAVDPFINQAKTSDIPGKRSNALRGLSYMLEDKKDAYVASGAIRDKIMKTLIESAISDKDHLVRSVVVKALGDTGDRDAIPVLEKIAQTDPYHLETKAVAGIDKDVAPGQPINRYTVRLTAQEAIKKIREGKKRNDLIVKEIFIK